MVQKIKRPRDDAYYESFKKVRKIAPKRGFDFNTDKTYNRKRKKKIIEEELEIWEEEFDIYQEEY